MTDPLEFWVRAVRCCPYVLTSRSKSRYIRSQIQITYPEGPDHLSVRNSAKHHYSSFCWASMGLSSCLPATAGYARTAFVVRDVFEVISVGKPNGACA